MTRTLNRWATFHINNAANTLTQITSVNNIGGVSLDSAAVDMTAWADTIKGVLLETPDFRCTVGGVFDSADHAVLIAINNLNTPRSFDIRIGLQAAYSAGSSPRFGCTRSGTTDGALLHNYTVDLNNMTWTAELVMLAGSTAPAWGLASETAGA